MRLNHGGKRWEVLASPQAQVCWFSADQPASKFWIPRALDRQWDSPPYPGIPDSALSPCTLPPWTLLPSIGETQINVWSSRNLPWAIGNRLVMWQKMLESSVRNRGGAEKTKLFYLCRYIVWEAFFFFWDQKKRELPSASLLPKNAPQQIGLGQDGARELGSRFRSLIFVARTQIVEPSPIAS